MAQAGQAIPMRPCEVLELGTTSKTEAEINAWLRENSPLFTTATYNLLTHNCNHFADRLAKFLTDGTGLPHRIVNIAEEALGTPQGQQIRMLIEGFDQNLRNSSANLNPFGNVTSGQGGGNMGAGGNVMGGSASAAAAGSAGGNGNTTENSIPKLTTKEEELCSGEAVQEAFAELSKEEFLRMIFSM